MVKLKELEVKNLIEVQDELVAREFLGKITNGENVSVSIYQNGKGKKLLWKDNEGNEKEIFVFDQCKCGNERWNAISVVRDLLNRLDSTRNWTHQKVEGMVSFE